MQEYIEEFDKLGFDGRLIAEKLKNEGIISSQEDKKADRPFFMDFSIVSVDNHDYAAKAASVSGKNFIYNLDKLIEGLPGLVMTGFFGDEASELKVFQIIIQVMVMVPSLLTVKISEKEAECFYAIWKSVKDTRKITEEEGFLFINEYMAKQGRSSIEFSEYDDIIRQLEKYGFLELEEGGIVIKEMVICHRDE